jgi:hypothetical protein
MMAWHSKEPRVCRKVSSLKGSRCSLSNVSNARPSYTSLPSWRTIFRARPSMST